MSIFEQKEIIEISSLGWKPSIMSHYTTSAFVANSRFELLTQAYEACEIPLLQLALQYKDKYK